MRLIMNAGHEHFVYGKLIHAGEEFEAPESEAIIWMMAGRARKAPQRNSTVATRSLQAAHENLPLEEPKQTRRYNRRDMRAEEDE